VIRGVRGVRVIMTYPRIRLAANQAQRLAGYLAALAEEEEMPTVTLGLQVSQVPERWTLWRNGKRLRDGFLKAQATSPFRCSPAHRAAQISFSRKVPAFMALINSHATVAPGTMAAGSDRSKGCGFSRPRYSCQQRTRFTSGFMIPVMAACLAMILTFAAARAACR